MQMLNLIATTLVVVAFVLLPAMPDGSALPVSLGAEIEESPDAGEASREQDSSSNPMLLSRSGNSALVASGLAAGSRPLLSLLRVYRV